MLCSMGWETHYSEDDDSYSPPPAIFCSKSF